MPDYSATYGIATFARLRGRVAAMRKLIAAGFGHDTANSIIGIELGEPGANDVEDA